MNHIYFKERGRGKVKGFLNIPFFHPQITQITQKKRRRVTAAIFSAFRPALRGVQGSPEPCVVQGAFDMCFLLTIPSPTPIIKMEKEKERLLKFKRPAGFLEVNCYPGEGRRWEKRDPGRPQKAG
jgi:hypothetical protein